MCGVALDCSRPRMHHTAVRALVRLSTGFEMIDCLHGYRRCGVVSLVVRLCLSSVGGQFSQAGASSCNACSAGHYSRSGGTCTLCPSGQISAAFANTCTACPGGSVPSSDRTYCVRYNLNTRERFGARYCCCSTGNQVVLACYDCFIGHQVCGWVLLERGRFDVLPLRRRAFQWLRLNNLPNLFQRLYSEH